MAYYVGDIPSEPVAIEPARGQEDIDLTKFTSASASLRKWGGAEVEATFAAVIESGMVVVNWPATSPFADAGLFTLNVTLNGTGVQERIAPVYFVAQDDDGWMNLDQTRGMWSGANQMTDELLWDALNLSKQQVLEFAPALADDAPIPDSYRSAQWKQAKNLWNANKANPSSGDTGDPDGFSLTIYPLDWQIRQILRPKRGVPVVG